MMTAAAAPARRPSRSPRESPLTKYFAIVLIVFGVLQVGLNLQYETDNNHHEHQEKHINEFKAKHLVKSNSNARKDYPDKGQDFENFEDEDAADNKAAEEERHADEKENAQHTIAGLNCEPFGGPDNEFAQEMLYWEDIPSDNTYVSPFANQKEKQYLTFEADHGGWNNIRMAMESVMTLAVAMGRSLVLPPAQHMYLLDKGGSNKDWSFAHFFHMESIADEHIGFEVITMEEFLQREGMAGNLKDKVTGEVIKPPGDRVSYDGERHNGIQTLEKYLAKVGTVPEWDPEDCLAAFPSTNDPKDVDSVQAIYDKVMANGGFGTYQQWVDKPHPVDAPPEDRLLENWAERKRLCIYNQTLQQQKLLHFSEGAGNEEGARLLVHFYAFLYFEDWKQDLWMKRFVRDHVRYIDEIQCAAARIIKAIRDRAKSRGVASGDYDAFHIRRGDFQYLVTRYDAPKIIQNAESELTPNSTIYIATDEKDRKFFEPFRERYDILFLDDFQDLLEGVNSNYYGMIDSLIASRSRVFFGCWFSTFTGYINRLRGYHNNKNKGPGYEMGYHRSYYYALDDRKFHLQQFYPVKKSFYAREFPTAWRQIDKGIGELQHLAVNQ